MQDDPNRGLYGKYRVERVDGKPIKGGCITLEFGDPHAIPALRTWADTVRAAGYEALADDVEAAIAAAQQGPANAVAQTA